MSRDSLASTNGSVGMSELSPLDRILALSQSAHLVGLTRDYTRVRHGKVEHVHGGPTRWARDPDLEASIKKAQGYLAQSRSKRGVRLGDIAYDLGIPHAKVKAKVESQIDSGNIANDHPTPGKYKLRVRTDAETFAPPPAPKAEFDFPDPWANLPPDEAPFELPAYVPTPEPAPVPYKKKRLTRRMLEKEPVPTRSGYIDR